MELTKDQVLHGFRVKYAQPLPELKATLYRMEYEKNGADLVWLDRPDDNKTFSIAFKTIPSDHTGVFHILEHSVLCGSDKYPVREPFVELLKSSLQTFLNAMTFPDKTMYPVSSRNDTDFLNLVDVYMDAVLHPLSVTDPTGYRQEGWHYELDSPDGELTRNGVVFNEMKGAFVDPEEVLSYYLGLGLFPDNCYKWCSGGHPEHIPELTYESYLANHAKYYHPSNSYIFLDGDMDLDKVLAKLDGFLAPYDRIEVDADIPMQQPVSPAETVAEYEIGPDEDPADKVLVGQGWVYGDYSDQEKIFGCSILATALCGTNESPLKKAILSQGLAQDVSFGSMDGIQQEYMLLVARNTSLEKKDALVETVRRVLTEQSQGLDHKRLHAILNQVEFANREKDYGRMPRGLVFAITAMETWLYGGDPSKSLDCSEVFKSLRKKIDEGWFEELIRTALLDNPHTARVVLTPSATVGAENAKREREELAAVKAGWDEAQTQAVIDGFTELRRRQSAVDTPEALATLPVLSLSDIPEEGKPLPYGSTEVDGVEVLTQSVETGGICYVGLNFRADDLTVDELRALPLTVGLLARLGTDKHSALELTSEIQEKLGRFTANARVFEHYSDGKAVPVVNVSLSLLPERKAEAVELTREVLTGTVFDDTDAIYNVLRQSRISVEQSVMGAGNSYAVVRAGAGLTASSAVGDALAGISQLRWLQEQDNGFETGSKQLIDGIKSLYGKIFTRGRVTASFTAELDRDFVSQLLSVLPEGEPGETVEYGPIERKSEGFSIPAGIGFAGRCVSLGSVGGSYSGSMSVASKLLTLDYLWNTVRVKGGAYGVNMSVSNSGTVTFSSYRDPNCTGSLDAFAAAGSVLRSFAESGESPDKYIISTIGGTEPVMTPLQEKGRAESMHFTGLTQEDVRRERREILRTTSDDLARFADMLDDLAGSAQVCVVGGQNVLDACGDKIAKTESVM